MSPQEVAWVAGVLSSRGEVFNDPPRLRVKHVEPQLAERLRKLLGGEVENTAGDPVSVFPISLSSWELVGKSAFDVMKRVEPLVVGFRRERMREARWLLK